MHFTQFLITIRFDYVILTQTKTLFVANCSPHVTHTLYSHHIWAKISGTETIIINIFKDAFQTYQFQIGFFITNNCNYFILAIFYSRTVLTNILKRRLPKCYARKWNIYAVNNRWSVKPTKVLQYSYPFNIFTFCACSASVQMHKIV